ncbi:MAG TPA: hypothetical protein VK966_00275 [Longimicrobiales bacterium]|nr:hypothetical protein [Longimicrobiales bacterium]
MSPNETSAPRRLRFFLRDHRVLDAYARVPQGQFLSTYLASRNRYINLTGVDWIGTTEKVPHMALKVDKILWVASQDGDLALTGGGESAARRVDVELDGGYMLSAGLLLVHNQRLSDYLQSAPPFVPLRDTELRPRGQRLGDVVVNQDAIQMVRELDAGADTDPHGDGVAGLASEPEPSSEAAPADA